MKKSVAQKLREHLALISRDDFQKEWAEIQSLGLSGPRTKDFSRSLSGHSISDGVSVSNEYSNIHCSTLLSNSYSQSYSASSVTCNYAMAA